MTNNKILPIALNEGNNQHVQPDQRNWFIRHPRASASLGAIVMVGGLSSWAVSRMGVESAPIVTIRSELSGCENGRRDSKPQPASYYRGQRFTIEALGHTVTLAVEEGSRIQQEGNVDEKVSLLLGDGAQPQPGQPASGTTLVYSFDKQVDVTVIAQPSSDPLLTDIRTIRSC